MLLIRDKPSLNGNINYTPIYTSFTQVLAYFALVYLTSLDYFILNIIIKL